MSSYLDTRDLYKRQAELQSDLDNLIEEFADLKEENSSHQEAEANLEEAGANLEEAEANLEEAEANLEEAEANLLEWQNEYGQELKALDDLESEVGRDWMHGTTLIPEDEFKDYARELAEDIGTDSNASWPLNCIDWDSAAEQLKQDYSSVEFEGTTYLYRY